MRKMTFTKAATCGEDLKSRVTPETWIAADFANQQEITLWVAQGNQIKHNKTHKVFGFKNGDVHNFTDKTNDACCELFDLYQEWQKHTQPRLIRVNGIEVPAPLESLDGLEFVWFVVASDPKKVFKAETISHNPLELKRLLNLGLCYPTKEAAIARAEAMLKYEVVE